MMPQVLLSRATRQQVEALARGYIDEALAAFPPVADEEPDERSGDAEAEADQTRDRADIAAENAEPGDAAAQGDRQSARKGKSVGGRVDTGGRRRVNKHKERRQRRK